MFGDVEKVSEEHGVTGCRRDRNFLTRSGLAVFASGAVGLVETVKMMFPLFWWGTSDSFTSSLITTVILMGVVQGREGLWKS